ncbi:MAG TPA: glycoside hydrolase family 88 protein [Hymenobacter sp.]
MKTILTALVASLGLLAAAPVLNTTKSLETVKAHFTRSLQNHPDPAKYPRSSNADGSFSAVASSDWTSGFFPGSLWYLYEYTKDKKWEAEARRWTAGLEKEQFNRGTHDLGFMLYCSYGNGLRLTNDPAYRAVLLAGAKSLMTRFNPRVGAIKSWDTKQWQYPVIVDNMMNLELLFWATKASGDSSYYKAAVTHALTTMKNHFRPDNSSYHVVNYDTLTGRVLARETAQGFANESAWARGQAWGLYGYTATYRATKDRRFLAQAQRIADFFLHHPALPADKVPYWDFNVPTPGPANEPRDASAAAIAASGLLELSQYAGKQGAEYKQAALQILESLSSPNYLAKPGTNNDFVLMHSTGHKPAKSEMDVPLVYADYYYIEGLLRARKMGIK